jgi:hypothetical protein
MKRSSLPIGLALTCVLFALNLHAATSNATNAPLHQWKPHKTGTRLNSPTSLQLQTHRGLASPRIIDSDTTEWSRQVIISNKLNGHVMVQTNSFTELGNGHNYLGSDGLWRRSRAQFVQQGNHFVAETGHHKVRLANNLNQPGAVDLITPSGVHLRSSPLAIGYYDPTTGQSVTLAVLQNCFGQQVSSNTVVYAHAFQEINCSLEFVDEPAGLHQNLIFHESPPDPTSLGLTAAAHIQLFTEFMADTPAPSKRISQTNQPEQRNPHIPARPARSRPQFAFDDETLTFAGEISFVAGKAFGISGSQQRDSTFVYKKFYATAGRSILIESVSHKSLKPSFSRLPQSHVVKADFPAPVIMASVVDPKRLPARHPLTDKTEPLVAKFVRPENSVVLDYETLTASTQTAITLKGDSTTLISGTVTIHHLTIEGGAVVKFRGGLGSRIWVDTDPVDCRTSQYLPAIFTAEDDHTVGTVIDPTHTYDPSGYYADVALICSGNASDIHDLRISYVATAIVFRPGTQSHSPRHLQIRDVNCGIQVWGTSEWGSFASVNPDNVLFNRVGYCFAGNGYFLSARHLTVNGATAIASYSESDNGLYFQNCLFANINSDLVERYYEDNKYVGGWVVGYYNCASVSQPFFGETQIFSETDPFQTVGLGAHYLKSDSVFRGVGDSAIYDVGDAFHSRSTQPPIVLQNFIVEGTIALLPQAPRYIDDSNPDLGAWYPAIDYLASGVDVYSGSITVSGGAAVATMNGLDDYGGIQYGIRLNIGASMESRGLPLKPNRIFYAGAVQEQFDPLGRAVDAAGIGPTYHLAIDDEGSDGIYEFTEFSSPSRPHYHYFAQNKDAVKFQNCTFRRGYFADFQSYDGGTLALNNNLFEGVELHSIQVWNYEGIITSARTTATFFNNTFERGKFLLVPAADDNTPADFTIKDNLFDGTTFQSESRLTHGYNCYNRTLGGRIGSLQTGDVESENSALFAAGPFGNYYQTGNSLNNGSRLASEAGMYHYTTKVDQTKKGNGSVGIGMHYVAAAAGAPLDTDTDGIPDYVENWHGDGDYPSHTNDETNWNNDTTETGIPDLQNEKNANLDLTGSGLAGRIKKALGLSFFNSENQLGLAEVVPATDPAIVNLKVPVGYALVNDASPSRIGKLNLLMDGVPISAGCEATADGKCLLTWDLNFNLPGFHLLQAELVLDHVLVSGPVPDTTVIRAYGIPIAYTSNSRIQFDPFYSQFDDAHGAILYATTPTSSDASYSIELKTTGNVHIKTISGNTWTGDISEHWNLTDDQGHAVTYNSINAIFSVAIPDQGTYNATFNLNRVTDQFLPADGAFTVAYGGDYLADEQDLRSLIQSVVVDYLLGDCNENFCFDHPYSSTYNRWSALQGVPGHLGSQDNCDALLANLANEALFGPLTKNFYYFGHANSGTLETAHNNQFFTASALSERLGNHGFAYYEPGSRPGIHRFGQAYRLVFLDGCDTAHDPEWAHAFGVYDRITTRHLATWPEQVQAFIGWDGLKAVPFVGQKLDMVNCYAVFWSAWQNGMPLDRCIWFASQDFPPAPFNFSNLWQYNFGPRYQHWPASNRKKEGIVNDPKIRVYGYAGITRTSYVPGYDDSVYHK